MSRFRSRWLAFFGGAILIALSVSTVFGAKPNVETNTGQQVSAFVHSLVGDVEEPTDEQVDQPADTQTDTQDATDTQVDQPADTQTDTQDATDTQVDTSQPDNHGACVSLVAHSGALGGDNGNHGGAVSEAARVTCRPGATTEEPTTEQPADNKASAETEADATDQSDSGHAHGGGHGHGHGHGG